MNTKRVFQKIVFAMLTLAACAGLVVLLVAAIGRKNHELCRDFVIAIKGPQKTSFIDTADIRKMLNKAANGKIRGEAISAFNLRMLEEQLKENTWIQNVNLYFDNQDVLHVAVQEDEPVARVFTTAGKSFYIDSSMKQLPLSDRTSARVPVFTSFPEKKNLSIKDSAVLNDVRKIACYILRDSFWMAQTEQIDINAERNFELIPTVGNHVVKLGDGDDLDQKFRRLLIFYQQVLSKAGFNKYNVVDVQFSGQVIGSKKKISKVDSVQLKKNVEKLLQEERQVQNDPAASMPLTNSGNITTDEQPAENAAPHQQPHSNSLKTNPVAKPKLIASDTSAKKPKAVMPSKHD